MSINTLTLKFSPESISNLNSKSERGKENRLYLRYKDVVSEGENAKYQYLDLDLIDTINLDYSSRITEYPMLNNDIISDHMYREPGSISISGAFSTSGKLSNSYQGSGALRLENVQNLFEYLKDSRKFIDIMSPYKIRENYLLQNISWIEKTNTLDYTFKFKQIHLATAPEIGVDIDLRDENLPSIVDIVKLDFTDEFLDKNKVIEAIIEVLKELDVVDGQFLIAMGTVTTAIAASMTTLIIAVALSVSAIPGIGWFIGAAAILAVGITMIVRGAISRANKKKIKKFATYKNSAKTEAEQKRFADFIQSMFDQIEVMENYSKVYSLPNSGDQEAFLNINGQYYGFEFTRNNSDNSYSLKVTDMEDNLKYSNGKLIGLSSLDECTEDNDIFRNINGSQVFIFDKSLMDVRNDNNLAYKAYNDLRDFMILVTDIKLNEWVNIISEIVENAVIG